METHKNVTPQLEISFRNISQFFQKVCRVSAILQRCEAQNLLRIWCGRSLVQELLRLDIHFCFVSMLETGDPKVVIISQWNDDFVRNRDYKHFHWCCSHWFFSVDGTSSSENGPGFSHKAPGGQSANHLSIFSMPGMKGWAQGNGSLLD